MRYRIGVVEIVVGMCWNRRSSAMGYWINIVTLTAVDVGFIVIVSFRTCRSGLLAWDRRSGNRP